MLPVPLAGAVTLPPPVAGDRPGDAGDAGRAGVGHAGPGDGAGAGVGDHDGVGGAACPAPPMVDAVGLGDGQVGLRASGVSVSVAVLLAGSGSVAPAGGVTVAVLARVPVAAGSIWTVKVKVTVAPTGRSTVVARSPRAAGRPGDACRRRCWRWPSRWRR